MRAVSRLVAVHRDGATRLETVRCETPLLIRSTGPGEVHLVAGAGGPIGGDHLRLELVVDDGAELTVRTAAASIVLPGPTGTGSRFEVVAHVGRNARLCWLPEPTVAAARCRHRSTGTVHLTSSSALVWRDELVLGRHGERSGSLTARTDVTADDTPVLRQELAIGGDDGGWDSAAVVHGHRAVGSTVVVDPRWANPPATEVVAPTAAVLALGERAALVSALAADAVELRSMLAAGATQLAGSGDHPAGHGRRRQ